MSEYDAETPFTTAGLEVLPVRLPHYRLETYGFRVTNGKATLAYTGDTGPSERIAELARDADLLVCEATLETGSADGEPRGHLSAEEALDAYAASGARELLLTHRPSELVDPAGRRARLRRDGARRRAAVGSRGRLKSRDASGFSQTPPSIGVAMSELGQHRSAARHVRSSQLVLHLTTATLVDVTSAYRATSLARRLTECRPQGSALAGRDDVRVDHPRIAHTSTTASFARMRAEPGWRRDSGRC